MSLRQEKVNSLLRNLAAKFLARELDRKTLVSVTNIKVSSDLKNATVFIIVFPEKEEGVILGKIRPGEFRGFVKENMKTKFLPAFEFKIDESLKKERKMDKLIDSTK
ncbi:MAG: ribosome-binding factor A [Parcubacteria group bacterium CG10_big_fil_rev_8_21_14_0_10_38_31]|nr:MAG: ribosome-binding factor A [Parcubacteria group bacterium CG10_big_fil_rev_8_21_14_0_10_38_31]